MAACSRFRQKALLWRIWIAAFAVVMTRVPACVVWAEDSNSTASNSTESPESTELTDNYSDYVDDECANEFRALNGNGTELESLRTTLESKETCATETDAYPITACLHDFRQTNTSAYTELCSKEGGTVLQFDVYGSSFSCNGVSLKQVQAPLCFPSATCNTSISEGVGPFYGAVPPFSLLGSCNVEQYDVEREPQGCVNETKALYDRYKDDGSEVVSLLYEVLDFFTSTTTFGCSKPKDGAWCTNDYRQSNISDFEAMCTANGGQMLQHDVTTQCPISGETSTYTMLSEPRCVGPSCSAVDALDGATYVPSIYMLSSFPQSANFSVGIVEYPLNDGCNLTIKEADPLAKTASAAFRRFPTCRADWTMAAAAVAGSVLSLLFAMVAAV